MSAQPVTHTTSAAQSGGFERFAGLCAMLAGVVGFLYALSFIVLKNDILIDVFLMLGGLLSLAALTGLYVRVKESEGAQLAWLLGILGALGALVHGGYDLANAINPPAVNVALSNLPSAVDPRGLLTFGVTGLGFFAFAWLIARAANFPRALVYLTYLLALLLVVLYLGRLIILDAKNPLIVVVALLSGFIVNPLWFVWIGSVLWQGKK